MKTVKTLSTTLIVLIMLIGVNIEVNAQKYYAVLAVEEKEGSSSEIITEMTIRYLSIGFRICVIEKNPFLDNLKYNNMINF